MRFARLIVGLSLIGLSGCLGNTKVEPMPVGHIVPMSGPGEFRGDRSRQAILLALEDLNKPENRGSLRPTLVQHADGRNGPATATRLLKIDRVLALLDSTDPLQLAGIATAAAAAETPVITTSPWSPPPPNDFVFSLVASPLYQGQIMARFAREELKLDSLLVWTDGRIPACSVLADAFNQEWVKGGGRPGPGPMTYDPESDVKGRVEQIKMLAPPAVLFIGTADRLVQVQALLREALPATPLLFAGDEGALLALAGSPPSSGKVYLATALANEGLTETGQEIAKAYKDRFGDDLDVQAALAYDGVRLLTEVLRKAKSPGDGLRKELSGVEAFGSLTGPLSFTKSGAARRPVFVVVVEGKQTTLVKTYEAEPK